MNVSEVAKRIAFSKAYEFLDRNPEQNFLKLVDWLEKLDKNGFVASQLPTIKKYASDPDNNWYKLALSLWNDVDDEVRKTLFTNFMINGDVLNNSRLEENRREYECNIPWAVTINLDPAENADGSLKDEALSFDELDSLVEQGKALGVYMYAFCGSEPLERRDNLIALCNKNSECVFLCLTRGAAIDPEMAHDLLRVRNCIPVIAVDGFQKDTDAREGEGAFFKAVQAMNLLKKEKALFGISCCYNGQNCEIVGSEAFFDTVIDWGAKFASFSAYMPTGSGTDGEWMLSAEQRAYFHRQLKAFRKTKSLMTIDHWNDGDFMGGCLAGGRGYVHINAGGDVEPCLYVHYSDSNIREKTLLQALQSPFCKSFHEQQPFNANLLRPCPMMDSPERIVKLVEDAGAVCTAPASIDIRELSGCCRDFARDWKTVADEMWKESGHTL